MINSFGASTGPSMMKKQNLRTTTRPDQLTERTEGTACNCALWLLVPMAIVEPQRSRCHWLRRRRDGGILKGTTTIMCRNNRALEQYT
jgi:hypothetical protein